MLEKRLAEWLPTTGAVRCESTLNMLGGFGQGGMILVMSDGSREQVRLPSELDLVAYEFRLRDAMVDSLRGAWTWAHVWMDAGELVLHAEFDWMREPLFDRGSRVPSDEGCAQELEMYPRAWEFIPVWMAEGARRHSLELAPVDVDVLDLLVRLFPETADIDGNGLFVWPDSREGAEERMQRVLEAWLPTTGARRVDIDCYVLDRYEVLDTRLRMADGAAVVVTLTEPEAWFWGEKVRAVMAVPGRGAWTHAHVWMEAGDLVLRCEYEWDRRPPFLDDMIDKERTHWLEAELRRFPRTPEHTPTWMTETR